jgi:two-component system phosphate regulon sensor histidine kinase PhoR
VNLADRVARYVSRAGWLTAAAVWAGVLLAQGIGLGVVPTGLLVALVAAVVQWWARWRARQLLLPSVRRLDVLAQETREMAETGQLDTRLAELDEPEVAQLARAINQLVSRVQSERKGVAAESLRSRTMAEGSPNGVLVVENRGKIEYENPAFARLFRPRAEPIGLRPLEAYEVPAVQRVVDEVVETGASVELPATTGESEVLLRGVPLGDGATMVVCTDISQFRQAEQARTDFVTNVSHELRTPIAAIMGFAETLEGDELPPGSRRLVAAISRNGRRLSELFEDLLALAKIEARRRELPTSMRKLAPLIEESLTTARDRTDAKGQQLQVTCPTEVTARINPQALVAIVSNLALNASNYTPQGGSIEVVVSQEPDAAVVVVRDDGIGIEPSQIGRIFERFYRASGADVTVESVVGEGSVFTVRFPTG